MILFPNAKINFGLHIIARRTDGFHEIETVFYPVSGLCDAVEVLRVVPSVPAASDAVAPSNGQMPPLTFQADQEVVFSSSGLVVDCPPEKNLCLKAFRLLQEAFPERIGPTQIHLHKTIPFGAGLGGGSADATAVLQALNRIYALELTAEQLDIYAAVLGSDTPFFLHNRPMLGTGRGERLRSVELSLTGWWILLVKPDVNVSTAEAYSLVPPCKPSKSVAEILSQPIETWREELVNDFEQPLFERLPQLRQIKEKLYETGAVYASLSGSGSAIYGIFRELPAIDYPGCFIHVERG